jgi:hypothetical protein
MDSLHKDVEAVEAGRGDASYVAPELLALGSLREFTQTEVPESGGTELGPSVRVSD